MQLSELYLLSEDIDEIMANLAGKILIIFNIKTTGIDPDADYTQLLSIGAIALDSDTGVEVDIFSEEASLNLATWRKMDEEDGLLAAHEWTHGDMAVRDWLNMADYDPEEGTERPRDLDMALDFKTFVDKYSGQAILIAHNAKFMVRHININLPSPIRGIPVVDTLDFVKLYFEPVLKAMMMQGSQKATDMAEKIWDDMRETMEPSIHGLSRALGVRRAKWQASTPIEEARQLGQVFSKMVRFIRRHRSVIKGDEYKSLAAAAAARLAPKTEPTSV